MLEKPVVINEKNSRGSLESACSAARLSGHKIYVIVDESDSFVNDQIQDTPLDSPDVDTEEKLKRYSQTVSGKEGLLRLFGATLKKNTGAAIGRIFMTGIAPIALAEGSESMNMMLNLTHDPTFSEIFGFREESVRGALERIAQDRGLPAAEVVEQHLAVIRRNYDGYRFHPAQAEGLYNPQQSYYYLRHLAAHGTAPDNLLDENMENTTRAVGFLLSLYRLDMSKTAEQRVGHVLKYSASDFFGDVPVELLRAFKSAAILDNHSEAAVATLLYHYGFLTHADPQAESTIEWTKHRTDPRLKLLTSSNEIHRDLLLRSAWESNKNLFLSARDMYRQIPVKEKRLIHAAGLAIMEKLMESYFPN